MTLAILLGVHVILSLAGFAFLWTRIVDLKTEVATLRAAQGAVVRRKNARAAGGATVPITVADAPKHVDGPLARAARAWGLTPEQARLEYRGPTLTPETARGLTLALLAVAPAFAFFSADHAAIVASGLAIAAAMMVIALRPIWRAAAWAAVFTAGAWALVGFALGAAHFDPVSYAICVAAAGLTGIIHAHLRRATPGATMAIAMAAALIALGSQIGMVSAAGVGFSVIVAAAAIVGAVSLRLEAMHLAAFGAAIIGLFVLTGQPDAAIWFTPAAAWAGALFFAIAMVRVPQLGPRGVALAGTGAFAPLGAIAALHAAQHGLANDYAAAAVFFVLGAAIAGIIVLAALRRASGLAALRVTLWVLAFASFIAFASAFMLALPAPLAAAAFAALSLSLAALNQRFESFAWRAFAVLAGFFALAFAFISARALLSETSALAPWATIAAGVALPAFVIGCASLLFARAKTLTTAALFEAATIILALAAANLVARLVFSNGAPLMNPVGFVETGVHASLWLAAALIIGWRASLGATHIRAGAMNALLILAFVTIAFAAGLWVTSFWNERPMPALALRDTMGFIIPSFFFWGHWLFWRARGANLQTRLALAASTLTLAAAITTEAMRSSTLPDWGSALIGAFTFAAAVGANFAPIVVKGEQLPRLRSRGRAPSPAATPTARSSEA